MRRKENSVIKIAYSSVIPSKSKNSDILKITKQDLMVIGAAIATTIGVWISASIYANFHNIFSFWDAVGMVVRIRKMSSVPLNIDMNKYIPPLPLPTYLLRILKFICLGKIELAQMIFTLFFSGFSALLFRKLLITFSISSEVDFLSYTFAIFPIRFLLYRSLPTYDTMFLCLIFLSLICYKMDLIVPTVIFLVASSLTRYESIIIYLTIIICYCLAKQFPKAAIIFGVMAVMEFFTLYSNPNWKMSIVPCGDEKSFGWIPMRYYLELKNSISNLRKIHSIMMITVPALFGCISLLFQSLPLSIFGFLYLYFVSLLRTDDMHRFAIPIHIISLLCGCNFILSNSFLKLVLVVTSPILYLVMLFYCGKQLQTNQIRNEAWRAITTY